MSLVDVLGLAAGTVWLLAAIYLELIRDGRAPIEVVCLFAGIGSGIIMLSSAPFSTSRHITTTLIITGHLLFLILGLGAWYWADNVALWFSDTDAPDDRTYH